MFEHPCLQAVCMECKKKQVWLNTWLKDASVKLIFLSEQDPEAYFS